MQSIWYRVLVVNLSVPLQDVTPGVRGALLQALARLEKPMTRRQVAVAAGVAPGNGNGVLNSLIIAGLVTETKAGNASLVMLNRNHLAAPSVIALAGLRGELIRRLRERLSVWPDLRGSWLFGSVARGEATEGSDIDVLLIAEDLESPDLHDRIASIQFECKSWTGNDLQLVEHSPASWAKLVSTKNPLVPQIRLDGIALVVHDTSLMERKR
jgi:predicted nucleotidyltransferase